VFIWNGVELQKWMRLYDKIEGSLNELGKYDGEWMKRSTMLYQLVA
jgi:hypothetical protein